MDLIQMKKKVQKKDDDRNKLIGQRELLLKELKKLGFISVQEAEASGLKLKESILKKEKHYETGVAKFKKEYKHLLL